MRAKQINYKEVTLKEIRLLEIDDSNIDLIEFVKKSGCRLLTKKQLINMVEEYKKNKQKQNTLQSVIRILFESNIFVSLQNLLQTHQLSALADKECLPLSTLHEIYLIVYNCKAFDAVTKNLCEQLTCYTKPIMRIILNWHNSIILAPEEVWIKILTYLEIKDLFKFATICTDARRLTTDRALLRTPFINFKKNINNYTHLFHTKFATFLALPNGKHILTSLNELILLNQFGKVERTVQIYSSLDYYKTIFSFINDQELNSDFIEAIVKLDSQVGMAAIIAVSKNYFVMQGKRCYEVRKLINLDLVIPEVDNFLCISPNGKYYLYKAYSKEEVFIKMTNIDSLDSHSISCYRDFDIKLNCLFQFSNDGSKVFYVINQQVGIYDLTQRHSYQLQIDIREKISHFALSPDDQYFAIAIPTPKIQKNIIDEWMALKQGVSYTMDHDSDFFVKIYSLTSKQCVFAKVFSDDIQYLNFTTTGCLIVLSGCLEQTILHSIQFNVIRAQSLEIETNESCLHSSNYHSLSR